MQGMMASDGFCDRMDYPAAGGGLKDPTLEQSSQYFPTYTLNTTVQSSVVSSGFGLR
jgi:hypothetical protein